MSFASYAPLGHRPLGPIFTISVSVERKRNPVSTRWASSFERCKILLYMVVQSYFPFVDET